MNVKIQFKGIDEVITKLEQKKSKVKSEIKIAFGIACEKDARDIKELINIVGEPDGVPRRRTGNLLMSIRVGKFKEEGTKFSQTVGANPDGNTEGYASWLEHGTSKMKARPYVSLVHEKNKENSMNQINKAMKNTC